MPRDATSAAPARCVLVWLVVTAAAAATMRMAGGAATTVATAAPWHGSFEALLVSLATCALVVCSAWLWLTTTITVVELVARRPPSPAAGLTRRMVLIACGAAVAAGISSPAMAGGGSAGGPTEGLAGLPLPDRAVASRPMSPPAPALLTRARHVTATRTAPKVPPGVVTVRAGDSLWSIAASALPPGAAPAEVDAAWREVYATNHAAIGADPDLIRVGTELLTLPAHDATAVPPPREARP